MNYIKTNKALFEIKQLQYKEKARLKTIADENSLFGMAYAIKAPKDYPYTIEEYIARCRAYYLMPATPTVDGKPCFYPMGHKTQLINMIRSNYERTFSI